MRPDPRDDNDAAQKTDVTNVAGFNRVAWDLTAEPPVAWLRAPSWNRGPSNGASLLPGTYTVRLTVDGREFRQPIVVAPDPRAQQSVAERAAHFAYEARLYDALSRIDAALNELDNVQLQLPKRIDALAKLPNASALIGEARAVLATAGSEAATLSSHPQNGQDNDFLRDVLRERIGSLIGITSTSSPTAEQTRASAELLAEVDAALGEHARFMASRVAALQTALRSRALALDLDARPAPAKPGERRDEYGSRDQ